MDDCQCQECQVDHLRKQVIDHTGADIEALELRGSVWYARLPTGGTVSVPKLIQIRRYHFFSEDKIHESY